MVASSEDNAMLRGISPAFAGLSPSRRQITHTLLTRSPLYSQDCSHFRVRLACVKHAASVHSEPGSNSPIKLWRIRSRFLPCSKNRADSRNFLSALTHRWHCSFFKEQRQFPKDKPVWGQLSSIQVDTNSVKPSFHCERNPDAFFKACLWGHSFEWRL